MPSNLLVLCHPFLPLPSIFSSIRIFSSELAVCIRWPEYWSFSFSTSLSNAYSVLTSFRIDWFDLLAVQGTLKSFLQHHSSKASVIWCSVIFMVQLTHPNVTTGINPSFDYMDICRQSNVSAFCVVYICHSFSSKEQASFNFMDTVTICSDFGAQGKSVTVFVFPLRFVMK